MGKRKSISKNKDKTVDQTPKGLKDLNLKLTEDKNQTNKDYLLGLLKEVDVLLEKGDSILGVIGNIYPDLAVDVVNKIAPVYNMLDGDLDTFKARSDKLKDKIAELIDDDIITGIDLADEVRKLIDESNLVIMPNINELHSIISNVKHIL